MTLRLEYPPLPENAPRFAAKIVEIARGVDGAELDYSGESLHAVDRIICGFRDERHAQEDIAETLFTFGCYVGEVLVRELDGQWVMPSDAGLPEQILRHFPFMVVKTAKGTIWSPITKVFKLFENGLEDSTHFLLAGG